MATIGLRDLYIAKVTEGEGGVETYGAPRRLAKAITVEMTTEVAEATLYADDGVDQIEKEFVKGEISINANDIANEDAAELLGQQQDDDMVVYAGEGDDPPYFAVGFRARKSGGKYRYIWLYKTKFKIPDETFETKGDSINFSTPTIVGEFIKRNKDEKWKADYVGVPTDAVASKWFTEVREPNNTTAA